MSSADEFSGNESIEEETVNTVVFDMGSFSCKAGYASQNFPEVDCRSLIGIPKYNGKISSELCNKDEIYIGDEAFCRPPLFLSRPIEQGLVQDWDEFEILLLNILSSKLRLAETRETPFIFTEPAVSSPDFKS